MSTRKHPNFIVFEGGEGSGKTNHMQLTKLWLEQQGFDVVTTHEPGGTALGVQVRELILTVDELDSRAESLLFMADRAQHCVEIKQHLSEGKIVLCDRFSGSTFAYQVGGRGIERNDITVLDEYSRSGLSPDTVVYLDINPEIGIARKNTQGGDEVTKFERIELEFHHKVRAEFQHQAKQDNWYTINADQTLEDAQNDIEQFLRTFTWN